MSSPSVVQRNIVCALASIEYLEQLLKASPQETFSKELLLRLTELVKDDLRLSAEIEDAAISQDAA